MEFSIFTNKCSHHHNQFQNIFITSERNPIPFSCHTPTIPYSPQLALSNQQLTFYIFTHTHPYCGYFIEMDYKHTLCDWFLSVSLMFSKYIHIVAYVSTSFLFMAEKHCYNTVKVWICHTLFIRPSTERIWDVFMFWLLSMRKFFCGDIHFPFSWRSISLPLYT